MSNDEQRAALSSVVNIRLDTTGRGGRVVALMFWRVGDNWQTATRKS
jgi:hypothetical protein